MEYLLLRQHVSALALGHHQVLNCASEETIQCSICNEISLIAWPLTPPTNDTEQTLLNTYLAWNTPRLSIPTAHPLHLVHNHAHFTYRVLTPYIAYDLDFITLASPDNCQWSRYQRDLVGWYELCEYYTDYSPLRHNLRPDDDPVQGPKHIVLVINTPLPY